MPDERGSTIGFAFDKTLPADRRPAETRLGSQSVLALLLSPQHVCRSFYLTHLPLDELRKISKGRIINLCSSAYLGGNSTSAICRARSFGAYSNFKRSQHL